MTKKKKQSKGKSNYDPAFHGGSHDLVPDPANDGTKLYVDGAGCFGGKADRDNPVFRIRDFMLQHPKEEFTSIELARALGFRHQEIMKPLLLACQQGILEKVRHPKHKVFKAGRSL